MLLIVFLLSNSSSSDLYDIGYVEMKKKQSQIRLDSLEINFSQEKGCIKSVKRLNA